MHKLFLTIALVFASLAIYPQQFISKINPGGSVQAIRGMIIAEDIFVTIDQKGSRKTDELSYLISPDGNNVIADMTVLHDKPVLAGIRRNDSTEFYFVESVKKKSVLKSWIMSNRTGKGSLLPGQIEIPGKVYGSYVQDGVLFLLCSLQKEFLLKLVGVRRSETISTIDFPLSFDLGKLKESAVSFYKEGGASLGQLMLSTRIVKQGNDIWIISDESPKLWNYSDNPPSTFRTTVIRMNIPTGKSTIRSFMEKTREEFSTAVRGNDVYRLTELFSGEMRIKHYSFETNKLIKEQIINPRNEDTVYYKMGRKKLVYNHVVPYSQREESAGVFILVDSVGTGPSIITCGRYAEVSNTPIILPVPVLAVAAVAVAMSSMIIRELSEGYDFAKYFYVTTDASQRFRIINKVPLTQQMVDEYEIQMQGARGYSYKGYLRQGNTAFWIYQRNKESPVEVVRFQM